METGRQRLLRPPSGDAWDIVVIGGGITGAAVLREAVRAGLSGLLLEQRDFAWGASSRTGKWVHGGLRYMKQGQINVTWHSTREREKLSAELTGLVEMQPLHWPLVRGRRGEELMMRAALFVYDVMAGRRRRRTVSQRAMEEAFPHLRVAGMKGAICFEEGQTDDARITLRVLAEARRQGGIALNYAPVTGLLKSGGQVCGVEVDLPGPERRPAVHARQVIAATGAWSDLLRAQVRHDGTQRLRPLRGSHLVFDRTRLPIGGAIVLQHPRDRRPGFAAPFEGRVIVGNTDLDHRQDMGEDASITAWEVDYLLETVRHHFPALGIGRADIVATFSGVRPVVDSGASDPSRESRDHAVWEEDGLITIGGGKLTTFRHIARDALERARPRLPHMARPDRRQPVLGDAARDLAAPPGLEARQWSRLVGRYGRNAQAIVGGAAPEDLDAIPGTETLWAELAWCAGNEDVRHLDDLLLRRTRIGLLLEGGGQAWMPRIRTTVQAPIGWSDTEWEAERVRYVALWRRHYSPPPQDMPVEAAAVRPRAAMTGTLRRP
jgi:glycerol-3-phosphate dehydrogenase